MLRKAFFLLAFVSSPALAQSWGPYGDRGVDWSGAASTKPTGSAPADAYEPAEVALPGDTTASAWKQTVADMAGTSGYGTDPGNEKKVRLTCEPSTTKLKDNILGFGIPSSGHLHSGFGAVNWDENSTYETLRASPASTCAGGPLNATNYMEPALLKPLPNGLTVTIRAQVQLNYYSEGVVSDPNHMTWLRRGTQFVLGANPRNFNDGPSATDPIGRRARYAAGGYLYPGSPVQPAGFYGWECALANDTAATVTDTTAQAQNDGGTHDTQTARYLKGPNGEDPWGGGCVGTVLAPARMIPLLTAPQCWDRHNLTSPDGRGQFWYKARKGDSSVTNACPKDASGGNYAHVPGLTVKPEYPTTGFADYGTWHLSSDRMDPAMTVQYGSANNSVTQGDPMSLSPCRQVGPYFCNGETLHADYTFGWLETGVFETIERECLGITVRGVAPVSGPAECGTNVIDRTHMLLVGTPPTTSYTGGCTVLLSCTNATPGNKERYEPVVAGAPVTVTMHHNQ